VSQSEAKAGDAPDDVVPTGYGMTYEIGCSSLRGARMWSDDRPTHTLAECHRLLDRLLLDAELKRASADAAGAHTRGTTVDALRRQGLALWDVFSDNHSVIDARGVCYSLGTFRSSGDEIADALMRHYSDSSYDYPTFPHASASRPDESRGSVTAFPDRPGH
jgi:hypothetical protein